MVKGNHLIKGPFPEDATSFVLTGGAAMFYNDRGDLLDTRRADRILPGVPDYRETLELAPWAAHRTLRQLAATRDTLREICDVATELLETDPDILDPERTDL